MNDYLSVVLPYCYGVLSLRSEEIMSLTPWEIGRMLEGYAAREKERAKFQLSFATVPIVNAAGHPKRPVTAKKLAPTLFMEQAETPEETKTSLMKLMEEQERRRKDGKS